MKANEMPRKEEACRQTFMAELLRAAKKDPSIMVLTSDATGSASLGDFSAELPEQFVECGIAEQDMVGIAAGLASVGKRPFVCAPASFLSARSFEQVKVDAAYSNKDVKLIGVSGGISYGALGESHYSVQDFAAMRAVANLAVLCPSDAVQAAALARALCEYKGPAYVRMGRGKCPVIYDGSESFRIGRAQLCRQGGDVSIIAVGELVASALDAAEMLQEEGVSARVLDMFTLDPIDVEAVMEAARETGAIVTAEEHSINGGLGAAVAQLTAAEHPVPIRCVALPAEVLLCGSPGEMKSHYGLDAEGIAAACRSVLGQKNG